MFTRSMIIISLALFSVSGFAQKKDTPKPKLVVGIVVDQMRYDYLVRFRPWFSQNGFVRLMENGSNFTFAHYNYVPTKTAPGHASVYTGTTPYYHGIIANEWYDRTLNRDISNVEDSTVTGVGTDTENGKMSPRHLKATTITDQLKLSNNGLSKVISVSAKDRGAILPGGFLSNGSYWYDQKNGKFVTSSFYMKELPKWVDDFNKRNLADQYAKMVWNTTFDIKEYKINYPDESPYEADVFNEGKTSFPHVLGNLKKEDQLWAIINTPFGDDMLLELAKAALVNENLGKGSYTDFLAVSFSSTDWIGHTHGPQSVEVMDTYIRLDRNIAELLDVLDKEVGKNQYILFLTADHGIQENLEFLSDQKVTAGHVNVKDLKTSVKELLNAKYGTEKLFEDFSNDQIFIDWDLVRKLNIDFNELQLAIRQHIRYNFSDIVSVKLRFELEGRTANRMEDKFLNGFNPNRSGDILLELPPAYMTDKRLLGTQHGVQYSYDSHIPILFYGMGIPKQTVSTPVYIVDIAPTIANLLGIMQPNANMGIPILEIK